MTEVNKTHEDATSTEATPDLEGYAKHYDEKTFWAKVGDMPRAAAGQVLHKALIARELMLDSSVPLWAKASLVGVLGYFVLPLDLIPDVMPGFGYADDLALLTMVLTNVDWLATDAIKARAMERMPRALRDENA